MAESFPQKPKTCGSCAYCITEEGEPFYCAMQDLYTFVKLNDAACLDFVSKERGDLKCQPHS